MQTKTESIIENVLNVGSGFLIALIVWTFLVTPLYGIQVSATQNLEITAIFTVVSVVRGYFWRRLFNRFTARRVQKQQEEKNSHAVTRNHWS